MRTWYRYSEESSSYATVKKWAAEFKRGNDSTEGDFWSGRPKTSITDEQVDVIDLMIWDDRPFTVQQIVKFIGISSGSVHSVF